MPAPSRRLRPQSCAHHQSGPGRLMGRFPHLVACPGTSLGSSAMGSPRRRGNSAVRCQFTRTHAAVRKGLQQIIQKQLWIGCEILPPRTREVAVLLVDIGGHQNRSKTDPKQIRSHSRSVPMSVSRAQRDLNLDLIISCCISASMHSRKVV